MIKSVICIVTAVFFLVLNTVMICLKTNYVYAKNDKQNYSIFYQKWIKTIIFMGTIIIALFTMYFAINLNHVISYLLLCIECIMVVIYALCKFKCVTVNDENITVERLLTKPLTATFNEISLVTYIPNAKIIVKLKRKGSFDLSFNSENFHRFFIALMEHQVKFKTNHIPDDENHVCVLRYGMTIKFPKTMFREYYQCNKYFHNSTYLFSARSLENHEYIEGYYKESTKELNEFTEIVNTDLAVNSFKPSKEYKEHINGYDFTVINSISTEDSQKARSAYIYKDINSYFVIYCDYLKENEETFLKKMNDSFKKTTFDDNKSKLVNV